MKQNERTFVWPGQVNSMCFGTGAECVQDTSLELPFSFLVARVQA